MEITDSFRVSTPIEETWKVLLDIERIAPCLPGAQLQEVEGEEYRGIVKVKVGPITAQYKGAARMAEVDEAKHRVVLDASGRDTRGQGNAKATISVNMASSADGGTAVDIHTDLQITGKVAQFGRGVLADVSTKLLGQFVDNLERDVLSGASASGASAASEAAPVAEAESASTDAPPAAGTSSAPTAGQPAAAPQTAEPTSGVRRIESREAEPVDLLDMAGAPVAQRLLPVGLAALVAFVLWRMFRHRR
ncbi:MAG: carbon monoxide dehydrogenase subunit [Actinomycetia bacterium]|jgi:carbon monoxide dehydrogenase subunit G|nr:carbon monoxide dehydrogenase subunit [Actinomycetes bacterium]